MPTIPFTEPVSPRYIHINAETNRVHLLVPVVGGQDISTDNTCKSTVALREFFDGGALRELTAYKSALALDIGLLEAGNAQRVVKEERLIQIEAYMEAISAMRLTYGEAMTAFLARPSNLYSIQLRPRVQDILSRVVNPAFNIERRNNAAGVPLSPLYNAMHSTFPGVAIAVSDPRTTLTTAVLGALPATPGFEDIQSVLGEHCLTRFGLTIDFTRRMDGTAANKAAIDALMGFGVDATRQDYIDALLGACAPDMWVTIPAPASLFYSISTATPVAERTEHLSMLTQFFLANLNIYCKARGISTQNFGTLLDASSALSGELVSVVSTALSAGDDVETALCTFCNVNADTFGLTRSLTVADVGAIKETFERTWRTVTATKENPHMDDFMILDKEATGEAAKFVTHQGAIGVDFADIVDATAASANPGYFESIRADFAAHPAAIPHRNESVAGEIDVDIETLLARFNDEQFERLPQTAKDVCRAHPTFQARHFLQDVAKGRQEEAETLLTATPANTQTLLRTPGIFTDYSGRTFNCTAYEYAYWAKDTHMCRMLEPHMDEETKAFMLTRIEANDATGLIFQQNGEEQQSAHFDLTALKTALQAYVDGYDAWDDASNWAAMEAAWLVVGKAQRNVPAHIAQEYCREDRSFSPTPQFNEATLPRVLTFYNFNTGASDSWFPLLSSNSGLGFDFGIIQAPGVGSWWERDGARLPAAPRGPRRGGALDLAAITRLDEVRTVDLTLSRDHLNPSASAPDMSM
jgi:hypothetical protein